MPTFSKFVEPDLRRACRCTSTTRARFDAIRTAVAMLVTAKQLYPDVFAWRPDNWIDKLSGSDRLRTMVDAGAGVDEVIGAWRAELAEFGRQRRRHLLYR